MAGSWVFDRPSDQFEPCAGLNFPQSYRGVGTNFNSEGLAFDGTTAEGGVGKFTLSGYTSGNITAKVIGYPASGTTNAYVFGLSLACITADTDTTDVETKAFATEVTGAKSHPGTTAKRLLTLTITINQLDSAADGDECWLKLRRLPADAGDTMTGIDVIVTKVILSWS